jgi:hypothetical protein
MANKLAIANKREAVVSVRHLKKKLPFQFVIANASEAI